VYASGRGEGHVQELLSRQEGHRGTARGGVVPGDATVGVAVAVAVAVALLVSQPSDTLLPPVLPTAPAS
jgi:hypothetical protein